MCTPPTGIDDGYDIEREMLEGMYQRIKAQEFRPGHDHGTQGLKVRLCVRVCVCTRKN